MASDAMDAEVDEAQDSISLSDLSLQGSDAESVWIKLFSSAPNPYSKDIFTLTGKAFHEITTREFDVDLDSFWISCDTTSILPAETSLDKLGIRSGSTIVIKAGETGGSSIQRSLEYFCPLPVP